MSTTTNARKIKLALTAGLINSNLSGNALQAVMDIMNSFAAEVGSLLDHLPGRRAKLGQDMIKETYIVRYERMTISIDLISNLRAKIQTIQGFQIS